MLDIQEAKYNRFMRYKHQAMQAIANSIAPAYQQVLNTVPQWQRATLYGTLTALKDRAAPSNQQRKSDLTRKMEALDAGLKNRNRFAWAQSWLVLETKLAKHGHYLQHEIVERFISAVNRTKSAIGANLGA